MREGRGSWLMKIISKWPVLSYDTFAIPLAWCTAFWLLSNMQGFPDSALTSSSLSALSVLSCIQWLFYYHFKVYRGLWCFSSLSDVARILQAVIAATAFVVPVLSIMSLLNTFPLAVFPLYGLLLAAILCGGRLLSRIYWDRCNKSGERTEVKRVLVIGSGQAGEGLIRELKRTHSYLPIGLVDDNVSKRGLDVHGVCVLGVIDDLLSLVEQHRIDLLFIAIPSARSADMRRIVNYCEQCRIPFRTLPSIHQLACGRVEVNALRDVHIEDLLGRDQVELHWDKIALDINQKRVLVTGGGGSIGSELCRQILALQPNSLLILDSSEFNLYKIDMELRASFPTIPISLALLNVVDEVAVDQIFQAFSPEVVFHAAAYKHVPLLEDQVRVAVQNNIIGTQIVAQASVAIGVQKFVLISTDKAVNPTSIMGTTKRVAELYCQNLNQRTSTEFITVRFGNVLGSVGSVVPLFQRQLQKGGPLTVTHPDMQRYFMTISEASQLILQAMANGKGGEIFVLDMGEPIKISYLAEQMIRLSGKEPGKDIMIEYTGLRPGEKLFEELFHDAEHLVPTEHEKLFRAKFRPIEWHDLSLAMRMLNKACMTYQTDELYVLLKSLVPEFICDMDVMTTIKDSTRNCLSEMPPSGDREGADF